MPSSNLAVLEPYIKVWDRALESANGLKLSFPDEKAARAYASRLYHARSAIAKSQIAMGSGSGTPYDSYQVRRVDNALVIEIIPTPEITEL